MLDQGFYDSILFFIKDDESRNVDKKYKKKKELNKKKWMAADSDKDNMLTKEEYNAFLHPNEFKHMHKAAADEIVYNIDKDEDGFISLEEYLGKQLEENWSFEWKFNIWLKWTLWLYTGMRSLSFRENFLHLLFDEGPLFETLNIAFRIYRQYNNFFIFRFLFQHYLRSIQRLQERVRLVVYILLLIKFI